MDSNKEKVNDSTTVNDLIITNCYLTSEERCTILQQRREAYMRVSPSLCTESSLVSLDGDSIKGPLTNEERSFILRQRRQAYMKVRKEWLTNLYENHRLGRNKGHKRKGKVHKVDKMNLATKEDYNCKAVKLISCGKKSKHKHYKKCEMNFCPSNEK